MMQKDLRSYLELLKKEAPEEIQLVYRTVDPRFELAAVIAKLESLNRYPALIFNRVQGSTFPVVSNLFSTRKRLAIALGGNETDLSDG
jgi:UbiD family decarboxylase